MASNGGTLNGVPQLIHQPPVGGVTCSQCGLIFDSSASLQVHMHYHHENQNRWGPTAPPSSSQQPPTSSTPTSSNNSGGGQSPASDLIQETNNNNQPLLKHNIQQITNKASSPTVSNSGLSSNTIAAADSSQPATPTTSMDPQSTFSDSAGLRNSAAYQPDLNYYMQQQHFEQSQHYQPHYGQQMDYQHPMSNNSSTNSSNGNNNSILMAQATQHEYKASVPSTRYHPYSSNSSNSNNNAIISSTGQQTTTSTSSIITSTTSSSVSPRIVSSTSPNNPHHGSIQQHLGQPTPSPSPKQCDKCGMVCETVNQLSDHVATVHGGEMQASNQQLTSTTITPNPSSNRPRSHDHHHNEFNPYPPMQYSSIKEEPACDILDLDSQKMVYPHHNNNDPTLMNNNQLPNEGPLPSMHSLHPMQAMQRHAMMWHQPQHENYLGNMHSQVGGHPNQIPLKQDYSLMSPVIKSEYGGLSNIPPPQNPSHLSSSPSSGSMSLKSEFTHLGSQHGLSADIKAFDQSSLTTSPPDFPTTTTPQDNNNNTNGNSFRNFEPPSSSLPTNVGSAKSASWKSNEARRPKTYNCTACNKWFTSSGHLKRHYNTTLHKNAVKSSGLPDPATMPISAHHHPTRDPNSKHHRNQNNQSNSGGQSVNTGQPPPQPPPDPQRSPEYTPQFVSGFAGSGQQQQQPLQGFQYGTTAIHSSAGGPPNGQAGPSVHASQPRGLLIYSNNNMATNQLPQQLQQPQQHHHITNSITTIPSTNHPNPTISPSTTITTTTNTMDLQDYTTSNRLHTTTTTINPHSMLPSSQPEHIIPHPPQLNYPIIIGSSSSSSQEMDQNNHHPHHNNHEHLGIQQFDDFDAAHSPEDHTRSVSSGMYSIRFLGGVGDTVPPFSPDVPDSYHKQTHLHHTISDLGFMHPPHLLSRALTPKLAATAPLSPAPGSPSVTSSDSMHHEPSSQDANSKHRCIQCDKVFNKACYLTQHNKTFHSGDKPFKCQRCGKRFPCGQSHEEHVAKHGGDKPFKCELCPKAFNHKTDLRRHMCLHSGAKPFVCETCGKGFIRKDHLVKHMDVHKRKTEQLKKKLDQQPTKSKGEKMAKNINMELNSSLDDSPLIIDSAMM